MHLPVDTFYCPVFFFFFYYFPISSISSSTVLSSSTPTVLSASCHLELLSQGGALRVTSWPRLRPRPTCFFFSLSSDFQQVRSCQVNTPCSRRISPSACDETEVRSSTDPKGLRKLPVSQSLGQRKPFHVYVTFLHGYQFDLGLLGAGV